MTSQYSSAGKTGRRRVLVVEHTATGRRALSEALQAMPEVESVNTAAHPSIAAAKLQRERVDVLVLDLEYGSECSPKQSADFVSLVARRDEAMATVVLARTQAWLPLKTRLERTVSAFVAKPAVSTIETFTQALRDAWQQLYGPADSPTRADTRGGGGATVVRLSPARLGVQPAVKLVAIGASTGGPDAIGDVLSQLPASFPVPIIITQHMPRDMTGHLAAGLNAKTGIRVKEARTGSSLDPGVALLAPGDMHLLIRASGRQPRVVLANTPPVHRCRPAVDPMFQTAAESFGRNVLAVVLTGMGCDGLDGCREVHQAGGTIIAQDEATSVVWGMPGAVARAAVVHHVLPLAEIGAMVAKLSGRAGSTAQTAGTLGRAGGMGR